MNSRQIRKRNHIRKFRFKKKEPTCPECGEKGKHFLHNGRIAAILPSYITGFWTCLKFYDPITGRRIDSTTKEALPFNDLDRDILNAIFKTK